GTGPDVSRIGGEHRSPAGRRAAAVAWEALMIRGSRNARRFLTAGVVLLGSVLAGVFSPVTGTSRPPAVAQALLARAQKEGALRVIVALRLPAGKSRPEGRLTSRA